MELEEAGNELEDLEDAGGELESLEEAGDNTGRPQRCRRQYLRILTKPTMFKVMEMSETLEELEIADDARGARDVGDS